MADLKPVYKAVSVETGEIALDELEEKWGAKYPIVLKSWRRALPSMAMWPPALVPWAEENSAMSRAKQVESPLGSRTLKSRKKVS